MNGRDLTAAAIAREYRMAAERLATSIPAPFQHRWSADARHALGWFGGDVLESVRYGASVTLVREPQCWEDLDQLRIEVRLCWSHSAGRTPDLAARRAILWIQQGPPHVGRWSDLLAPLSPFLQHEALEPLLADAVERITAALPRWSRYPRKDRCGSPARSPSTTRAAG